MLDQWNPLEKQEFTSSQTLLWRMYADGKKVPLDFNEVLKWLKLNAEKGDAHAQLCLGMMYAEGKGTPQDHKEAVRWCGLAAEQGFEPAQLVLGRMFP